MDLSTASHPLRVTVVTGSRAEFGLLEPTLARLAAAGWCALDVVVAGMHLVSRLGRTVDEVASRFRISARVPMDPPEDTRRGMALTVAEGVRGFATAFCTRERAPDLVVVLGDRTEAFAATLAATYLGVPVAHLHGGDATGNAIDDYHRDAISRAAVLHLAATERSAARLRRMGVRGNITVCGAPGLDRIVGRTPRPRDAVAAELGLPAEAGWTVVLYHPNPVRPDAAGREMREVLEAAMELCGREGDCLVILYPNNDAGHRAVVAEIESFTPGSAVRTFRSLPRETYLALLSHARLLIGNSSGGIVESAALGLRVVNVGDRQNGRERDGNVVDAEPDRDAVRAAVDLALSDPEVGRAVRSRRSVYGEGRASERIVEAIAAYLQSRQLETVGAAAPATTVWRDLEDGACT